MSVNITNEDERRVKQEILNDVNLAIMADVAPTAVKQINEANVLTKLLLGKAKKHTAGKKFEIRLDYGIVEARNMESKYSTLQRRIIEQYETITLTPEWVNSTVSIAQWDVDDGAEGSKLTLLNLSQGKINALTRGMKDKHQQNLFRPKGTAESYEMPSIYDWTLDVVTSTNIGGFTAADVADGFDWIPKVSDLSGESFSAANFITNTHAYFIEAVLRALITKIEEESGESPDLGIMPHYIWDLWDAYLTNRQQGVEGKRDYVAGYESIKFKGVNFVKDSYCIGGYKHYKAFGAPSTSVITILNTNYIEYHVKSKTNNQLKPWYMGDDQYVLHADMNWRGTIACTRRDVHGSIILPFANPDFSA